MKTIILRSLLLTCLIGQYAKADQWMELSKEAVGTANFVIQCPLLSQKDPIISAIKGTFEQGIVINFTLTSGRIIQAKWVAATRTYSCQ